MKTFPKFSAINVTLMILFLLLNGLTASWAFAFPQDDAAQVISANSAIDKKHIPPSDSLAKIACDKKVPYFTNLDPNNGQTNVPLNSTIKFRVNDDFTPKPDEWDKYGVDITKIFITIKTRLWRIELADSVRPDKITLVEGIYKVDCEYRPPQPFDWNDTVEVHLYATDVSYLQNSAETTYVFYTMEQPPDSDTTPPWFVDLVPAPGQPEVDTTSSIEFTVVDDFSGVDPASVKISVITRTWQKENETPALLQKFSKDSMRFVYDPNQDFPADDTVQVTLVASDLADPVNTGDTLYVFYTKRPSPPPPPADTTAPWFVDLVPASRQSEVDTTSSIEFTVVDDFSGVDPASVKISVKTRKWQKENETPVLLQKFSKDSMRFVYDPSQDFPADDTVQVTLVASDLTDPVNTGDTLYVFYTKRSNPPLPPTDKTAPWFVDLDPDSGDTNIAINSNIAFTVVDDSAGVDTNNVYISITSRNWQLEKVRVDSFEVITKDSARFVFDPDQDFTWDEAVTVTLVASDLAKAANTGDTLYVFYTIPPPPPDTTAPWFVALDPAPFDSNVARTSDIVFTVVDNISGVNVSTVKISIQARKWQVNEDAVNVFEMISKDSVRFSYKPLMEFDWTDSIYVKIVAFDNAIPPNKGDTSYVFYSVKDTNALPDLWILNFTSLSGDTVFQGQPLNLKAYIKCSFANVSDSFAVCFYRDDSDTFFEKKWLNGLSKDCTIPLELAIIPRTIGNLKIKAFVDCTNKIKEQNEDNNLAEVITVVIAFTKPELIVRSNPFTPNDDGFNDKVKFDFEQFDAENPNLKIFDIHGKKIKEFGTDQKQGKAFFWNGLDESGREVLPGAYLYIFSDKAKALARGCVVVAR